MDKFTLSAIPAFTDNYIWLLTDAAGRAVLVDPGDATPAQRALEEQDLKLVSVLLTHHHPDHMGGAAELAARHGCPVFGPEREAREAVSAPLREGMLADIPGMGLRFRVLDIPGHTAGHIAFEGCGILFCGDTMFSAGCGRPFEGTHMELYGSLMKLAVLPDDTRICCGHEYTLANLRFAAAVDPDNQAIRRYADECEVRHARGEATLPSTLALERQVNPFLRCETAAVRDTASRHAGRDLKDAVDVFTVIRQWKDGFQ